MFYDILTLIILVEVQYCKSDVWLNSKCLLQNSYVHYLD
jgi:hypothetical protein